MQVLNMERDLEALSVEENESISKYSYRISLIVNKIQLLVEDFPDSRIVGKVLVTHRKKLDLRFYLLKSAKILNIFQLLS